MLLQSRRALAVEKCAAQSQDSEGQTEHPVEFVVNTSQDFGGLRLTRVFLGRLFGLALANGSSAFDLDLERSPRHLKQASLHIRLDSSFLDSIACKVNRRRS